ncbi:MAG: hypothetical protein OXD31_11395 [Chloroflexi bacterium]|nr:hypothetical protein [Chloroflexota bacterium]
MKTSNIVIWMIALIAVALTASLVTASMVAASTDSGAPAVESSTVTQVDLIPTDLPMCRRIGARGVRLDAIQTWAADSEVILTLDDTCRIAKAQTNAVGIFGTLVPLVHQQHYTRTVGIATSKALVPYTTRIRVHINGDSATFGIPYTVSDVDIYDLSRDIGEHIMRVKTNPRLTRVAVSHGNTADWVGVFDFKGITLYPEMSAMSADMAQ